MLDRVFPGSLGLGEVDVFLQAINSDRHSGTLEEVALAILEGRKQLWRWREGQSLGIFVSLVNLNDDGTKEFVISGMAGIGLRFAPKRLMAEMERAAKDLECDYIVGFVDHPTIKKLYETKLGFEEKYSFMVKEISYG